MRRHHWHLSYGRFIFNLGNVFEGDQICVLWTILCPLDVPPFVQNFPRHVMVESDICSHHKTDTCTDALLEVSSNPLVMPTHAKAWSLHGMVGPDIPVQRQGCPAMEEHQTQIKSTCVGYFESVIADDCTAALGVCL